MPEISGRQTSIADLWESGQTVRAAVPLSIQGFLATVLIIIALSMSGYFLVSDKKTLPGVATSMLAGIVASLTFGFGGVFLIDAVGVYT